MFLSWLFVLVIMIGAVAFVVQGDIAVSLSQFKDWAWPPFKKKARRLWLWFRNLRRLLYVPFHVYLHNRTKDMPFAMGQVWMGVGRSVKIIGKAKNGDWVVQLDDNVVALEKAGLDVFREGLRDRIYRDTLYLYDWNQEVEYGQLVITTFGTMPALVMRPLE